MKISGSKCVCFVNRNGCTFKNGKCLIFKFGSRRAYICMQEDVTVLLPPSCCRMPSKVPLVGDKGLTGAKVPISLMAANILNVHSWGGGSAVAKARFPLCSSFPQWRLQSLNTLYKLMMNKTTLYFQYDLQAVLLPKTWNELGTSNWWPREV